MPKLTIARPEAVEYNPHYAGYIAKVQGDALAQLERQAKETPAFLASIPEAKALHRYAPGKWSIKEVVGHVADAERVFAYRALRFGRGDASALAKFDENAYVPAGNFDARPLADLAAELAAVRAATLALVRGLPAGAFERQGIASGHPVTVRALVHIIAGHERHHLDIIKERYLA